jgi:hypothetical protein
MGFVALADGGQFGVRMALVNGDEFGAEAETDDCDIWFGCGHNLEGDRFSILTWRGKHYCYAVAMAY